MTTRTIVLNNWLPLKIKFSLSWRFFWTFAALSFIFLMATSVVQIASYAKERYLFQEHQQSIISLTKANETLEVGFSKTASLTNVEKYLLTQNFIKTNKIKYIQLPENQMVRK